MLQKGLGATVAGDYDDCYGGPAVLQAGRWWGGRGSILRVLRTRKKTEGIFCSVSYCVILFGTNLGPLELYLLVNIKCVLYNGS